MWAVLRDVQTGAGSAGSSNTYAIRGPFAVGTELSVTPAGAQEALTSIIVELVDGAAYADQTEFNGLIFTDRYTLAPLDGGGTRIIHQLVIGGPAAATVGPQLIAGLRRQY